MKEAEHHRWQHYLILAVVLTIFGLMIYQVVMQEQKVDQYYVSLVLTPAGQDVTGGLPVYPAGASGTLNAGIQQVRDAVAELVADQGLNLNVPHATKWKLNIIPVVDPTDGSLNIVNYHYTFPVRANLLDQTDSILKSTLEDALTITGLFGAPTTVRGAWAAAVFDDNVHASLSYGTYGVGAVGQSTQ